MFSKIFYIFFWKIYLVFLLSLGELLGHKSKYAMTISGQMIPAEVLAWLFIRVLSHEIILLSIFLKGMLLLTYFLQSRQKGAGGKSLPSGFCYGTHFIPDRASALWSSPWMNGHSGVFTSRRQHTTLRLNEPQLDIFLESPWVTDLEDFSLMLAWAEHLVGE